jgi:hypothetical protein
VRGAIVHECGTFYATAWRVGVWEMGSLLTIEWILMEKLVKI